MSSPILVITEPTIEAPDIINILIPDSTEAGAAQNTEISMLRTMGKIVPIVKVNSKLLEHDDVVSFELKSVDYLPTLSLTFRDVGSTTMLLDTPGPDDTVQIQLLPKFDGIYKKINLVFYITEISMNRQKETCTIEAEYAVTGLFDSMLKSYGKINTYDYYNTVAQELGLGFCSNIKSADTADARYIYLRNTNSIKKLSTEFKRGGNPEMILDSWVDFYNNINLVDIYDLYYGDENWTDQPDGIKIYTTNNYNIPNADIDEVPFEISAIITNNPKFMQTDLYTENMRVKSICGSNKLRGTDKGINIYNMNKNINVSKLLQDGSGIDNNIYIKTIYRGEYKEGSTDNSDYLFQPEVCELFNQKINNNIIEITTTGLLFGLMRGGKVNVEWYDGNEIGNDLMNESSLELSANIQPDDDGGIGMDNEHSYRINNRISGQYVIVGTEIKFNMVEEYEGTDYRMRQKFILSRIVNFEESRYTKSVVQ